MSIIIISNRAIVAGETGEALFSDDFNSAGPGEIRIAKADFSNGAWQVDLVPEQDSTEGAPSASRAVFDEVRLSLVERSRNCVLFVHGFNQNLGTNLKKCKEIQDTYGVEVIGFSWASNPGGQDLSEYERAKSAAQLSVNAFDRTLHKLSSYLGSYLLEDCGVSLNLLAHGAGAYLLEHVVRAPLFCRQSRLFDNIILHQADIDNPGHAEWMDRARYGKRMYVTINETDHVLKWADLNFQPGRLGNTRSNLDSCNAKYIDFTKADLVGTAHRIYWKSRHNPNVRAFFRAALHGKRAEKCDGLEFDDSVNVYSVV